jgi:hypothetical protein
MAFVQFTAEFKFSEKGGNLRRERVLRTQQIATRLFTLLDAEAGLVMPRPAGSQFSRQGTRQAFSELGMGLRYVPQAGQQPARLILTAMHEFTGDLPNPYANRDVLSGGQYWTGQLATVQKAADTNVQATFNAKVLALIAILNDAVADINSEYDDADVELYRLDYAGINYGGLSRGYHFPH